MHWALISLQTFIFLFSAIPVFAQTSYAATEDSIAQYVIRQIKTEVHRNGTDEVVDVYKAHLPFFRMDDSLFSETIEYFLGTNRHDIAIEVLKTNPFLMSQHNEQALYHYYRGVTHMLDPRGWPYFKMAEKSMNQSILFLRRSLAPDYGFYSDVENARGYLSIVARGLSTDTTKAPRCIIRSEFIYQAIDRFQEALVYNPDNEVAQGNLDTLLRMLELADLPPPEERYGKKKYAINSSISLDSVNIDSMNTVSLQPMLDYSLMPKNYQLILSELQVYDEILLLIDLSGSMDDPVGWSNEASKFAVAQQLALYIAMHLRSNVFLGAISVGQDCDTTSMVMNHPIAGISRQELTVTFNEIRPHGHTPLNQRIRMTKNMFSPRPNKKLVFLLSDGMDTCGEIPNLCGTASMLASHGIDLSVFSFIYESLDEESRSAYSIYTCMVNPSQGKIYKITDNGDVRDQIDYEPISNNILQLPSMDTSILWGNHPTLFQFNIEGVEPPIDRIMKLTRGRE